MSIPSFSVRNPVFANLLLLVMLIGGAASYHYMPREVFPEISLDIVLITADYQGASPEDVERQVTLSIENAIEGIENIDTVASQSYENISVTEVKIQQGTADIQSLVTEIKDEVDNITDFPEGVERPRVLLIESEMPVINVVIAGSASEAVRREAAWELKNRLVRVDGVSKVQLSGYRDKEVWVELDPLRISALGITPMQVSAAISAANQNMPSGVISSETEEFPIKTVAEIKTAEQVKQVVVTRDSSGRAILVSDVASVVDRFEEATTIGRVDGEDGITMMVMKSKRGSTIEVANLVHEVVRQFKKEVPSIISVKTNQDSSRYVKQRLKTLYTSGGIGLFMVCVVLFIFLNGRMAFWTALGIPASFMGTFLVMSYFGITINMMSLFAFIIVLGMVVDDAIIVTENVYRYILLGMPPSRAAARGAMEVLGPITAATATTMAAFLPMLMMSGIMGKFVSTIPIIVSLTLLASFIEAFFILPSHLADWSGTPKAGSKLHKESAWFIKVRRGYRHLIKVLLKQRYKTLAVVLLISIAAGYYTVNYMKFVLFSGKDIVSFVVRIEMPDGAGLQETQVALKKVEHLAAGLPKQDLLTTVSMVGIQLDYSTGRIRMGANLAQTLFELTEFETQGRRNGKLIMEEVRKKAEMLTGIRTIEVVGVGGGPPIGSALEARIAGDDYLILREMSEKMKQFLKTVAGTKNIKDNYSAGKQELHIKPDRQKLALFGITEQELAINVRAGFDGLVATTIKDGTDDIDVRVIFNQEARGDREFIPQISIATRHGGMVRLSSLADVEWKRGLNTINRFERKRVIKVYADVDDDVLTSSELTRLTEKYFNSIKGSYAGYKMTFGGESAEQRKSVSSLLQASLLALLLIYLILGTLFKSFLQPIVVISAIPFSFIGVLLGHELLGQPLGMLSLIGLAALSGIVINDSLVMVDFINQSRLRGGGRWISILRSAFVRFRPVILTSLTTILGLSTLAFKTTGQAAFLAPMAISIVFGLFFSTILTLIIIPCIYAVLDDFMLKVYGSEGLVFKERDV